MEGTLLLQVHRLHRWRPYAAPCDRTLPYVSYIPNPRCLPVTYFTTFPTIDLCVLCGTYFDGCVS